VSPLDKAIITKKLSVIVEALRTLEPIMAMPLED